jgi:pimeloyl-ACP methyl ester carboxylesterase
MLAHGATGRATGYLNTGNREIPDRLTQRGYLCLADDLGDGVSTDGWGNNGVSHPVTGTGRAALDALEAMGATGPHDGIGFSMGCLNLLNIGRLAPTRLRRLVLTCPVVDPTDIHDNDRGGIGLAAAIEAAYGGLAGYNANIAARNPNDSAFRAAIIAAGWRIRVYYSTNDPIIMPAIVTAWCTAVGAEAISMGDVGHYTGPENAEAVADCLWAA